MEVKEIIELMKAVSDNGLTRFELECGETKLVMKREKQITAVGIGGHGEKGNAGGMAVPMYRGDGIMYTTVTNAAVPESEEGNVIKCPLVGTFYASPSPEAEPFVKVGDHVKKGQVVGIVEAMKLMNEIESEFDGVVDAVFVDNESTVEYGQPLFRIR